MTTTSTWLAAPTGFPAQGGVDARPALPGGVAVRDGVRTVAAVLGVQGSGVPTSGAVIENLKARTADLLGVPVFVDATGLTTDHRMTYIENNGTTFGYLSSRRPSS
jgi:hypothetical protein